MATSDLKREIEEATKASIVRRFSTTVKQVSLVTQPSPSILIAVDQQGTDEKSFDEELMSHVQKLMALFDIQNPKVIIQREENEYPSPLIILQTIKVLAPVSIGALAMALRKNGYGLANDEWVRQRLDAFRKQGFTSRRDNATYVLTFSGLIKLGSQRNRRSTDVRRALEMARWKD